MVFYSPLRYPGGKGRLCKLVECIIRKNNISNCTYVEPFAGGAGVALELLEKGIVSNIVINDYDLAIASVWKAIINENKRFIEKISKIPVTIEEWHKQKNIFINSTKYSFDLGFATFYLNRTNRSGIIGGGPIGGYNQTGNWKIDARFNREDLIDRIQRINSVKNHIKVYNQDIRKFIKTYLPRYKNTFIYFDPPYLKKAEDLYMNYFDIDCHMEIADLIKKEVDSPWIMTYDDEPEIIDIYKDRLIRRFSLTYSVAKKRTASELMIFQSDALCPKEEDLREYKVNLNLF